MNLEAQLLQIIEQQQIQLKEQQKQQENALQRLEAQSKTIDQLESFNSELTKYVKLLIEKSNDQVNLINELKNPKFSESLLLELQESVQVQLEQYLIRSVSDLDIKKQVNTLITDIVPILVQKEITIQIEPLVSEFMSEKEEFRAYHENLAQLIQDISLRL